MRCQLCMRPTTQNSFVIAALLAASLGVVTSCGVTAPSGQPPAELAIGTWGGDTARVIVTANQVHVHIRCTLGDLAGPLTLDADGRFNESGSYVLRAYPVAVGPSLPAQFTGRVVGNRLTLAVAVNDTVEKRLVALGPVTLVLGQNSPMGNCPVCVVPPPLRSASGS